MNTEIQITEYDAPFTSFNSQYGKVSFQQWLGYEQDRLAKDGIDSEVKWSEDCAECALFRK